MDKREMYVRWLNDVYAMEKAIGKILDKQAQKTEDEEVKMLLEKHKETTERQAEMVRSRIEAQDGKVGKLKEVSVQVMAMVDALAMGMQHDRLIKNAIADYSVEHLEMAAYSALAEAATEMGDTETASMCAEIMKEEMQMAEILRKNVPVLARKVLQSHD